MTDLSWRGRAEGKRVKDGGKRWPKRDGKSAAGAEKWAGGGGDGMGVGVGYNRH